MMLLGAACTAILIWWIVKHFAGTDRARIATFGRRIGGVGALAVASLLALRGRLDMAMLVGAGGGWLLGWNALPPPFGARASAMPARLRSRWIEIELDASTGRVEGRVLGGPLAGRALVTLSESDLARLHDECLAGDPEGARLVEAYLDGRTPGWRERAEPRANDRRRADPQFGAMAQEEAYEVLGLQPGASEAAIRDAHRNLMKRLHPDGGGSTYLASRVNQAKDVLLDRHR